MQGLNWNDLRIAEALVHEGTLAGAGRRLGIDATTVARRLVALDQVLGVSLFQRGPDNRYRLSDAGEAALEPLGRIAEAVTEVQAIAGNARDTVRGVVRLTAVPVMVQQMLMPRLSALVTAHPDLRVALVPDVRKRSLTAQDADIAIRFARPETGGQQVNAVRIGDVRFGVFGPADAPEPRGWIGYDDAMRHLPQSRWVSALRGQRPAQVDVGDVQIAQEAAAAGMGKAVLPLFAGKADGRLRLISHDDLPPLPVREVWMLSLVSQAHLARIKVVKTWLKSLPWYAGAD